MEERLKHNIQSWHEPREREWKEKLFHLRSHKRNFDTWGFFEEGNVSQVNRICL